MLINSKFGVNKKRRTSLSPIDGIPPQSFLRLGECSVSSASAMFPTKGPIIPFSSEGPMPSLNEESSGPR